MIPSIRSFAELMVMTESRGQEKDFYSNEKAIKVTEDSGQRKRYLNSTQVKQIDLPEVPKIERDKWIKRRKAVSDFFNELDYNNQIQSSYDLTLIARQDQKNYHDAA